MTKKYTLSAEPRTLVGRKVKGLRKQGNIPATVYGKNIKSATLSVARDAFAKVYAQAGETGLIELTVGKDVRPVLVHMVQMDPVSDALLHIEFHQVDLKEKVKASVPIELVGEAPAVAQKVGTLLTVTDEIGVEALPTDLPERIAVDVSTLAQVDQEIKVADLNMPSGVTLLTDAGLTVVKVGSLISKEAEAQAAEEAAAAAAAATEGAEPAEGEAAAAEQAPTPAEEKAPEAKKEG